MPHLPSRAAAAGTLATLVAALALPAVAAPTVTVNGSPVNLSPQPIERAGRIFVPLRGVFEHLGATVVYDSGTINATGNGRTISLRVGSNTAAVNGQEQSLDEAPFLVGASTYVPLRFIAQALGAEVNYDGGNQVVAIAMRGGNDYNRNRDNGRNDNPPQTITPEPQRRSAIRFGTIRPENNSVVESNRPTIEGVFADGNADPNTIRIILDQLDVTQYATRSPGGFVYSPPSDLQAEGHRLRVVGKDTSGAPFDLAWTFRSGVDQARNSITDLRPNNGEAVGPNFTVSGRTMPNSLVTIDAGAQTVLGGLVSFGGDHLRIETQADQNGNFSREVHLNTQQGATVTLVVTSTEPRSKSSIGEKRQFAVR